MALKKEMQTGKRLRINEMIAENKNKKSMANIMEKIIPAILFILASITILTTLGILYTLLTEAIEFFKRVPIWEFFTTTELKPLSQNPKDRKSTRLNSSHVKI